jgi:hypothetical protein
MSFLARWDYQTFPFPFLVEKLSGLGSQRETECKELYWSLRWKSFNLIYVTRKCQFATALIMHPASSHLRTSMYIHVQSVA